MGFGGVLFFVLVLWWGFFPLVLHGWPLPRVREVGCSGAAAAAALGSHLIVPPAAAPSATMAPSPTDRAEEGGDRAGVEMHLTPLCPLPCAQHASVSGTRREWLPLAAAAALAAVKVLVVVVELRRRRPLWPTPRGSSPVAWPPRSGARSRHRSSVPVRGDSPLLSSATWEGGRQRRWRRRGRP